MDWTTALLIYSVVVVALLAGGVLIGTAIGLVGILGVTLASGTRLWPTFGDIIWNTSTSFTLVAIPMFILMGEIILRSGLAQRFYGGVATLLGPLPGGLAHTNIIGCAAFSALAGSTVATALTVGTVAIPEMRKRGYADTITLGSLTGGGCLGILIPPSIPMIVYATITQASVLDLFMAGIIPGLLLAALFSAYLFIRVLLNRDLAPVDTSDTGRGRGHALLDTLPVVGLVGAVIGGMYAGIVTPTEAAGFGTALALILGVFYRDLTLAALADAVRNAVVSSCVVMFITINAQFLSFAIVQSGIGHGLSTALADAGFGPFLFFCMLIVLYAIIGMLIDGLSIMLLTVPVLFPVFIAMDYDIVWTGVLIVLLIELGALTPPMGLNLFAIQSVSGVPLGTIARASLPYALIIVGFAFLLYFFPSIALFLPQAMRG